LKERLFINVLVLVFVALATLYSAAIPLGEGPDEPGHAAYVLFLARAGRLPVQRLDTRQADVPGEGHQPPMAYALAVPLTLWLPLDERRVDTIGNPRFVWSGGAEPNAISHGSHEYPPWQGFVLAWHLVRLASVVSGAATVWFTYLAARAVDCRLRIANCRLQPDESQSTIYNLQSAMPLLAAGLVAFNPQFLFVAALVTNDGLLAAFSAALLWLAVRAENQKLEHNQPGANSNQLIDAIIMGVVLGLALLTKQSAVILAPIAVLAVISRQRAEWRSWRVRWGDLRALWPGLLVIATAALIAGWWYARNQQLYGDLLGLAAFRGEFATQPFQISRLAAWAAALGQLHGSFWARFGWMNVAPPVWALWLIGAIELIALAGLARRMGWALRTKRSAASDRWSSTLVLSQVGASIGHWSLLALPMLALTWITSFAITAGLVAWQGRLLFPALPAIAILLARGLTAWAEPRAEQDIAWSKERDLSKPPKQGSQHKELRNRLIVMVALCLLLLLALWMPENVIRPAYPPQTLPEPVALARAENLVLFRFRRRGERSITLRGWRVKGAARPGAALDLTLTWYASARQVRDWVVFVQLVDRQGRVVAEEQRQPRDGAFPTTQWNMGDWIEDQHRLQLPANLAGGTYTLRVGLYDPAQNNQRAEVRIDETRPLGDVLDLASIIVVDGG
jgi:Dolichyl-phosphate-mannose-protein mannosyltransferase